MTDARRRQWVPLSVDVARSRTGVNLQKRFGRDGLLVWMLVLAAAKKSLNQGEFEYITEADGWHRLGLIDPPNHFTLDEFFAYTGRIHATRTSPKRAENDAQTSQIRAWNEWKTSAERRLDAEKKSRKRAQNTGDIRTNLQGTDSDLDSDSEREGEIDEEQRAKNAAEAKRLLEQLTGRLGTTPVESDIPF